MQCRPALLILRLHTRPQLQQHRHSLHVPALRRKHQGRVARVGRGPVHGCIVRVEGTDHGGMAGFCGAGEGRVADCGGVDGGAAGEEGSDEGGVVEFAGPGEGEGGGEGGGGGGVGWVGGEEVPWFRGRGGRGVGVLEGGVCEM